MSIVVASWLDISEKEACKGGGGSSVANTVADALHGHCAGASALEGGRWGIPREGLQGAIQLGGVGHFGDSHVLYVW